MKCCSLCGRGCIETVPFHDLQMHYEIELEKGMKKCEKNLFRKKFPFFFWNSLAPLNSVFELRLCLKTTTFTRLACTTCKFACPVSITNQFLTKEVTLHRMYYVCVLLETIVGKNLMTIARYCSFLCFVLCAQ